MQPVPGLAPAAPLDFDAWRTSVVSACGRFQIEPAGSGGAFAGSVLCQRDGTLAFTALEGRGARVFRDRRDVAAEDGKYYFLVLQRSGRACMSQAGESADLTPGDMVLIDACRPCDFRYDTGWSQLSCHLPRTRVDEAFRHVRMRPGARIAGDGRLGALLGHLVLDAHAGLAHFAEHESTAVRQALLALLPSAFADDAPASGSDAARYRRALALIDERLVDPALGPAEIASAAGLSLRQLHRLFARHGQTVARTIQERRLERCAHDLGNAHCPRSITTIAFFWGFSDAAHFARAFKTRYGVSPRDYRSTARQAGH